MRRSRRDLHRQTLTQAKRFSTRRASTCHLTAAGEKNYERPNLWGIVGRPKGSESDVQYSSVLKEAGGNWTFEELNSFLSHPTLTLPGTDMAFAGLQDEQQRADVIAYLRTLSDSPVPLPEN